MKMKVYEFWLREQFKGQAIENMADILNIVRDIREKVKASE